MSAKRLRAVLKVLEEDSEIAAWYAEEQQVFAKDFTVQNVREYNLDGMGYAADQIIADGADAGILTPEEVVDNERI